MAKARARTTSRKVKDRWKAKNWYQILAPSLFNNVPVAETLAETSRQPHRQSYRSLPARPHQRFSKIPY